jgi:hypothetical protein
MVEAMLESPFPVAKQIVEGRDVNLATLLIPYYETNIKDKDKDDIRIKRPLSITEVISAFGQYKRVMQQFVSEFVTWSKPCWNPRFRLRTEN